MVRHRVRVDIQCVSTYSDRIEKSDSTVLCDKYKEIFYKNKATSLKRELMNFSVAYVNEPSNIAQDICLIDFKHNMNYALSWAKLDAK